MRPLVEAGKLYRAVTPLYIIRQGKQEHYIYTEEEYSNWKKINGNPSEVLRAKGYEVVWPLSTFPFISGVRI